MAGLTVLIPTLNEAARLPLLLADLARWPTDVQVVVIDAGSVDATRTLATLAGAEVLLSSEAGRGQQLILGMARRRHDWILVLHADSRLPDRWPDAVNAVLLGPSSDRHGWYFDFQVEGDRPMLRLLERAVALRSGCGQRPYGDQGLLIHQNLYTAVGGYKPIPLMEDLDLVQRIARQHRLRRLLCPLVTSNRRWQEQGVLSRAWNNWMLRRRWRNGTAAEQLVDDYGR
ncbi:MAG: TIGR04283 family arsenosugar biosynthesis glycosyltransferase [Synechococcus sp.]|nr:TIGR04283 family arsenosugar biosynthesis glycosyltransferase [Synechococcus sp.]